MAPSVAEIPEVAPTPITVAVKAVLEKAEAANEAAAEAKPRVRRIIDEEGGNTTATVCHIEHFIFRNLADANSIHITSLSGTTARSIRLLSLSSTLIMERMPIQPSKTS
jgi:hypothetical protein